MIDGDGTYDPAELPKFIELIEQNNADMVIGNRFAGMQPMAMSMINRVGNRVLSWLARIMLGIDVKDTQSGYRAMTRELIEIVPLSSSGMPFATELLVESCAYGFRVKEVPITYRPRLGGESKLNPLKDGFRILKTIVNFTLRYNPVFFIFSLGALLLIPGLVLGAYVAYHYFFTGIKYYIKGLIAIMLTTVGFISMLLAILAIYLKRMEFRFMRMLKLYRLKD